MEKKHRPEGFHAITPQLSVEDGGRAMDFYKQAFGAVEIARALDPSGKKVWHGVMRLHDSMFFVNDTFPDMGGTLSRAQLWVYVPDVDALFKQAVAAGCTGKMPPMDMFWGDRFAKVLDPFGHSWSIATHLEDLSPEEMAKRGAVALKEMMAKK